MGSTITAGRPHTIKGDPRPLRWYVQSIGSAVRSRPEGASLRDLVEAMGDVPTREGLVGAFCALLELYPEIRELITNFHASRYSVCLSIMSKLKPLLEVDLYMRAHVDEIFQQIRFKALVLYFSPYQSVDVRRMALAFYMDLASLEKDVATLIMNGVINARIDSENKMLYAHHADERQVTFDAAFALAENFRVNTKALLLRLNLLRSDFTLKGPGGDRRGNKSSRQEGREMNEPRMPERFYSAGPSDVAP